MRLTAAPSAPLTGTARVPSDKSISHRALLLGAMAAGTTEIAALLEAGDVMRTAAALRAAGVSVERRGGVYRVTGGAWASPERIVYMGNAGTGARLFLGAAAGRGIALQIDGDASLRRRPMARVTDPLETMGAAIGTRGGLMPVTLRARALQGIEYRLPQPSAQVKSALLLAGLGAVGATTVIEPTPTRDHTERMLGAFGAPPEIEESAAGGRRITVTGGTALQAARIAVPADPSSAAFPLVASLIVPGSKVTLEEVMINKRRSGLLDVLLRMGAKLTLSAKRHVGGEEAADIVAEAGPLRALEVSAGEVPDMIDEIPILAVAAAFAEGTTRIEGLEELKVKESDRLAATAALLRANGVTVRSGEDWLEIDGAAGKVPGGGAVATAHDHRIAMSALVLGGAAKAPVGIDDAGPVATSFPDFAALMNALGAKIGALP